LRLLRFRFRGMVALTVILYCLQVRASVRLAGDGNTERQGAREGEPVRLAVAGLVHGHVQGYLGQIAGRNDVRLVGIWEADSLLAARYAEVCRLDKTIFYTGLGKMLDETRPEAVMTFTSTFDHLQVVQGCAPRGIHVMVEKPLAVNLEHANRMKALVDQYSIQVMVNYETTWYASNQLAFKTAVTEKKLGRLRKIIFNTGHQGPREIGCQEEFLAWLTDPRLNGAGALYDFGCYGANIATWLIQDRPLSVTAITRQFKPMIYPHVDDEATVIVDYPGLQVIIQASWNWPFGRKDMTIYGSQGWFSAEDRENCSYRLNQDPEERVSAPPLAAPFNDPVSFLAAVTRGKALPDALSSLENNMVVTEILEAARKSAKSSKTVFLQR